MTGMLTSPPNHSLQRRGAVGVLHGGADEHDPTVGTGDGAADQDEVALGVDLDDLEVLHGDALATHAAGHAHATEGASRRRAGADGARVTVLLLHTVAVAHAGEVVALHDTGVALAAARAGDVDEVTRAEGRDGDRRAELGELVAVGHAELGDRTRGLDPGLAEVAGERTGRALRRAIGDLDGGVAVRLGRLDLRHRVRGRVHDGDGDDPSLVVEHLGHAELGPEDPSGAHVVDLLLRRAAPRTS
jgi:hypothetical protein